jgi:hypothetical protein
MTAPQKGRTSTLEAVLPRQISHAAPYLDEICRHHFVVDDKDETEHDRER